MCIVEVVRRTASISAILLLLTLTPQTSLCQTSAAPAGEATAQTDATSKAVAEVETAEAKAEAARLRLQFLENPLAPHTIVRWITHAGPRILIICIAMAVCWWLSRILAMRIVAAVIRRGGRGTEAEREGRAETLRRVFQSTASSAIAIVGILALLDQAGLNISVLLGGAAVIGAAVAFGSQNLIKDYFSGFMILAENQYSVGHVVRIGATAGVVEDITLRMTALRDEEGIVHFIPHSQVTTVSNLTYGWSRAVFKIGVGYGEDVDRVMKVLKELAQEMTRDEAFKDDLVGEPEMQGVDALGDSAVTIKFLVKTRPLRQWAVKREMLRRVKRRFDELGIEIPYPQQVIHTRPLKDSSQSSNGEHRAEHKPETESAE